MGVITSEEHLFQQKGILDSSAGRITAAGFHDDEDMCKITKRDERKSEYWTQQLRVVGSKKLSGV
jgi:hypothetical protein